MAPDPALERRLLLHLADVALPLPTDAGAIRGAIDTVSGGPAPFFPPPKKKVGGVWEQREPPPEVDPNLSKKGQN